MSTVDDAVADLWGVPVEKACAELHRLGLVDGDGVAKAGLTPEDWEQVKQIRRVFAGRVGQLYTRHMRAAGRVPRAGGKAHRWGRVPRCASDHVTEPAGMVIADSHVPGQEDTGSVAG